MIVGYAPGRGLLHEAHPFTTLTMAAVVVAGAFALPGPLGPSALTLALVALAFVARVPHTLVTAILIALPFWFFAWLIHAVLGDAPLRAVTLAARITAMLLTFVIVLATLHPTRLVDALLTRRIPFSVGYLFSSTLQAVPRLRARARAILDAQRCRGLRVRGTPWLRMRAMVPLAIPLVLGALAEVDERAFALESRGIASSARRTPLDPPPDSLFQRVLRWLLLGAALVVVGLRIFR